MRDFIETHLRINDAPFRFQPQMAAFIDYVGDNIYKSKPIIVKKARQVGLSTIIRAITLVAALNDNELTRIIHLHPTLAMAQLNGKELDHLILDANRGTKRKRNGAFKSVIEERIPWGPMTNTILFKMFDNENFIRNDTAGRDGDRMRGSRFEIGIFDEAQNMSEKGVLIAQRSLLKKNDEGISIFLITPDTNDFTKELWESSSQAEWNYVCPDCGHRFVLGKDNWEDVLVSGYNIKCTKCEKVFDKRSCAGEWINISDDSVSQGFHFNQAQLDVFSKEDIQKLVSIYPPDIVANDVFGEWNS